jgi:hypothetical protein
MSDDDLDALTLAQRQARAACPEWCHYGEGHILTEPHPEDRAHASDPVSVDDLELESRFVDMPDGTAVKADSADLLAWVERGHREAEPRILVTVHDARRLELTVREADLLSQVLGELVRLTRAD